MLSLILKKYWKLIGIFLSITTFLSSFYLLYRENISLEKTVSRHKITIKNKENRIVDLEREKILIENINKENIEQKKAMREELYISQNKLNKLKEGSVRNEEKGSECLNTVEPKSLNSRLRKQSRERNR